MLLTRKKNTFYLGDPLEKKAVSREVKNEIRKAKIQYKNNIENPYNSGDLKAAWHGIKTMAAINQPLCKTGQPIKLNGIDDSDLPNTFNQFFSRFERSFPDSIATLRETLKRGEGLKYNRPKSQRYLRKQK